MTSFEFLETIINRMKKKALEYAPGSNPFQNFDDTARRTGKTPLQCLLSFADKHITSVTQMINSGKSYPIEVWDEKLGDVIAYMALARGLSERDHVTDTFTESKIQLEISQERAAEAIANWLYDNQENEIQFSKWQALAIVLEDIDALGNECNTNYAQYAIINDKSSYENLYNLSLAWVKEHLTK